MRKNYCGSRPFMGYFLLFIMFMVLLFAFLFGFSKKAVAHDRTVKTYESCIIQEGDSLWSMALTYAPEEMEISQYIQEVRQVNHLKTNQIISGEALILPIYSSISE